MCEILFFFTCIDFLIFLKYIYKYRKKLKFHTSYYFGRYINEMLDFVDIDVTESKKAGIFVWPSFHYGVESKDLMIQGGAPKCMWDEANNIWTTSPRRMSQLIDSTVEELAYNKDIVGFIKKMDNSRTNVADEFNKYCRQYKDIGFPTDSKLTFLSQRTRKEDYCTKRLDYDIDDSPTPCFDELMSKLYEPKEAEKIMWGIGTIVSGDSTKLQKMFVLHGMPGTGKTTILDIIRMLFKGYCVAFSAEQLGYSGNQFSMAPFRTNPLVAIDDDGDLSKIETNVLLNMVASHASTIINEKNKAQYCMAPIAQMWIATNLPVRISGINSGLVRRIIDVKTKDIRNPIPTDRYNALIAGINNELPGIASKCLQIYSKLGKDYFKMYEPIEFMRRTDYIFNFVSEMAEQWQDQDEVTLAQAWEQWKTYCHEIGLDTKMNRNSLATNLKNYFDEFYERNGGKYSVFKGFHLSAKVGSDEDADWLNLIDQPSIFDEEHSECLACYSSDGIPETSWDKCRTKLSELDTSKEHFVGGEAVGWNVHEIVIDFDAKNERGEKDYGRNKLLASTWPKTYAETSKSGSGLHLHYYYTGSDVKSLERRISPDIEVKVFSGKASLRRRLVRCNREPIATLRPGILKLKEEKVISFDEFKDQEHLQNFIKKCIAKAHHGSTKPEIDYMFTGLEKAYQSGMPYDIEDMKKDVWKFASSSTHNASYCQEVVMKMHFKSEHEFTATEQTEKPWAIFDVEVFPNWNCLNWCLFDKDKFLSGAPYEECIVGKVHEVWCPDRKTVEAFVNGYNIIGFNNRRYDNHILYAMLMGYSTGEVYKVSQRLIFDDSWSGFLEAYNLSYFDIYCMSNTKQSLKKWEIELGIAHVENEYAWDQDLAEEHWQEVSSYCVNDVKATCAVLCHLIDDFRAREILATISGLPMNATTNKHTTQIITGGDKDANKKYIYTDLSNDFPGYTYDHGKSIYRGEEVGEGGYVYSEPGYYTDVALLDIASMHPHSLIALNMFGPYTEQFKQLVESRILVKHKDYEGACNILGGALKPFLQPDMANSKKLAFALKIAINSVYGLTSAKFDNALRDPRNKDNIVAKRGALFMVELKHFVQERGFTVAHIKTDSIKIPNATPEIIKEVYEFGLKYGYTFEHEATYKKLLLIDKAQYIAQDAEDGHWTATGKEFQQPPVFKGLFTKEDITIKDQAITFEVETHLKLGDRYIGKVGSFVPAIGGKELVRWNKKTEKYGAATGAKGYNWELTEYALIPEMNIVVDESYWELKRAEAVQLIEQYVPFEEFIKED